ncbi:hypothetical protein PV11_03512 [Exophiala sideris]|uniref:Acyclic terpene utilisation N-terminal domain-containing protein n=1 Tax=Exophiala sideris TaxID=1016849 RepID=A0A0D1VY65_9EURO|nr:hypothetical protein PV11_03512 [Exophiala sideris]
MSFQRNPSRPIRIGSASGGVYDRKRALHDLAKHENLDVIVGDWMNEGQMARRGAERAGLQVGSASGGVGVRGYDPYFLQQLEPALPWLARNKVRLITNAGASNVSGVASAVEDLVKKNDLPLKVAWVEGDDFLETVLELYRQGKDKFNNLDDGTPLAERGHEPIAAQACLGGSGVMKALENGADIVVCGRIADASGCVGAAMWWYQWTREDNLDELAGALVAGHLIECTNYVTGGAFSGFKRFSPFDQYVDLGFPVVEIQAGGDFTLTKEQGTQGEVSVETTSSQLIYEIQGPWYYNSDVVALLEGVRIEPRGNDVVYVSGIKGSPPPPTTKVGLTAIGGQQAEYHFFLTGLDIDEKAASIEKQVKASMGTEIKKFHVLDFSKLGSVPDDPRTMHEATVDYRVFVQTRDPEILSPQNYSDSSKPSFFAMCKLNSFIAYIYNLMER